MFCFFKKVETSEPVIVEEVTIDTDRYDSYHTSNAWGR